MNRASAGRRDSRSDCLVEVEARTKGGIVVELASKVKSLYGSDITGLAVSVLEALGVPHARVTIQDEGALPFVLAARLESAVRRIQPSLSKEYLPDPARQLFSPPGKEHLRRSRLYLPGNQPKFFPNAGLHRPDCVILDLEDSVHPDEKDAARLLVRNALRVVDFGYAERMVRINQGREGITDLHCLVPVMPDTVVVPKCESAEQIIEVDREIQRIRREVKISREILILPIIESALGIHNAYEVASASKRICALAIGLEDYTADIGAERTVQGRESLYARQALVNAAKAAGVQALDSVFSDVDDVEGLAESCREARAFGFDGKGCIHPRQIRIIHQAFAPTGKDIAWAQQVTLAFEAAQKSKMAVVAVGSRMIDPPVVRRAQRDLALAVASGVVPSNWRADITLQSAPMDSETVLPEGE